MAQGRKPQQQSQPTELVTLGYHGGNTAMVIAEDYATVEAVVGELAQNMIDAEATSGVITLDLQKKRLTTLDNGLGASIDEMKNRVGHICACQKSDDKIGKKGMGNLAPIGIAVRYSMVTHPRDRKPAEPFFRIDFNREHLDGQQDVRLPLTVLQGFGFHEPGWTTSVSISKIVDGALMRLRREPNPLETICGEVSRRFEAKIKQTGIKITVRLIDASGSKSECVVTPKEFPGQKTTVEILTKRGTVTFDLYLTSTKVKGKPVVLVEHQGKDSFDLRNMEDIWSQVSDVFGSGFIQGRIKLGFCELTGDRRALQWSDDLGDFIDAVFKFAADHGRDWLKRLSKQQEDEMFENVARDVLAAADEFFRENPALLSDEFKAAVSPGHVGAGKGTPAGKRIRTKKKPDGVPPLIPPPEPPVDIVPPKGKKKERKMRHSGVESPTGTPRMVIAGQSGLQIVGDDGSTTGWRARVDGGKIVINVAHRDYREAEYQKRKTILDTYVRLLVMCILAKPLIIPADHAENFQRQFEDTFMCFRNMITPAIQKKA